MRHSILARCWFVVLSFLPAVALRAQAAEPPAEALERLLAASWEFDLREDPLLATHAGDHRFDDRLPSLTLADVRRRIAAQRAFLAQWKAIDRAALSPADRINYDIYGQLLSSELAEADFQMYLMPISNRDGFHISFAELPGDSRLDSTGDYEHYIARLRAFERYTAEHIELMRLGIKAGLTLPQITLTDWRPSVETHIVTDPTKSLLYAPFREFPKQIPEADRARLEAAGRAAISESVVPGYRKFLLFMEKEYVPAARGSIGASALPRGREFYRHRVRKFTTLDLSPEQVHEQGLAEVERIDGEMRSVKDKAGFKGDVAAFIAKLRTDPKFYAASSEELLRHAAFVMKEIDGRLPKLFKTLPRSPCGLREVPAYIAPVTTTAYYSLPTGDGTQPGWYNVNTSNLPSRPLFELEALTCHEALPGHHLQLALQQELGQLPPMRRYAGFTAFVEGWGLYSERLGIELGLYRDPHSDFGRLSYEAWRACRLVVDTGIHYLGWSRQQANDFMAQHTALSLHNIRAEVDRYIAWPGQAVAYKIGELQIRKLRARAEEQLGSRFDVRAFHEVVLGSGAVPLGVLEDNVNDYIRSANATAAVPASNLATPSSSP